MITDSTILISAHSKVSIENSFEKRKKTVELPKSQNMSDLQISDSFEKLMSFWIERICLSLFARLTESWNSRIMGAPIDVQTTFSIDVC